LLAAFAEDAGWSPPIFVLAIKVSTLPAAWHPQATLFDVTKVILIFSAQHSE